MFVRKGQALGSVLHSAAPGAEPEEQSPPKPKRSKPTAPEPAPEERPVVPEKRPEPEPSPKRGVVDFLKDPSV